MRYAYAVQDGKLRQLPPQSPAAEAVWVDLLRPIEAQRAEVESLDIRLPDADEVGGLELSGCLYRRGEAVYITVMLPGKSVSGEAMRGPVTFILTPDRLVSLRAFQPRPFETYAPRAHTTTAGLGSADRIFLGLMEELVGRLADILEEVGEELDAISSEIFRGKTRGTQALLQDALRREGQMGLIVGEVRLSLLTLDRALAYFAQGLEIHPEAEELARIQTGRAQDIHALTVHADYLSNRVSLATDVTLGMVDLDQSQTSRMHSLVAAMFLPPTLIASIYGMNFAEMPELENPLGYEIVLGAMAASVVVTWVIFKWRGWL